MFDLQQVREFAHQHDQSQWSDSFLERHHLYGFAYSRSKEKALYGEWKEQLSRNFLIRCELEKLGLDFETECLDVCLLKGFSLMGDIYKDWGQRFASDVDLLINLQDLWKLSDILNLHGFRKKSETKWLGNRFKFLFYKSVKGLDVVIEVHTQLFWHTEMEWQSDLRLAPIHGFSSLSYEKQLAHLCGHLGFQHTFQKLFWLVDIFKFVETYQYHIDWDVFWSLCLKNEVYKSAMISLLRCQNLGLNIEEEIALAPKKYSVSLWILRKVVNLNFLYDPEKRTLRYLLVKNLIKDKLYRNFTYWRAWLAERSRIANSVD